MKRLITKNKIANAGGMIGKPVDSKIILKILAFNHVASVGYSENGSNSIHTVEANFEYNDEEGNLIPNPTNGIFKLPKTDLSVNDAYNLIKDSIPSDLNFTERFEAEVLAFAKLEMANTLNISPTDIEEIV